VKSAILADHGLRSTPYEANMVQATLYFPSDFRWGTATSAHQCEGNNTNNDWYAWEQAEGHIQGGQKSGLACDWWNRAEADLERAAELGQTTHRLSVEWSRIEPSEGKWDDAAIDRYRQMLRFMREHGLEPMVILHHFTTPLWLAERGGWENPTIIPLFERFATKVAHSLGEFCDLWVTINEPVLYAILGWVAGGQRGETHHQLTFPPGKQDMNLGLQVIENVMMGHGAAYYAVHRVQPKARVGACHNMTYFQPLHRNSPLDQFVVGVRERLMNQPGLAATLEGRIMKLVGARRVKQLANTSDFIGLNYYMRTLLTFDPATPGTVFSRQVFPPGAEISDWNYGEVYPEGIFHLLKRLARYGKPIYITENGLPDADDDRRPAFLITHLRQIWKAVNQNVPVMGYYHWSLVDNFEWAEGWNLRFGLIEVNPETQARQLRRSGELYAEICKSNQITTDMVQRYAPELEASVFPG
jgi:beta-glucosidase